MEPWRSSSSIARRRWALIADDLTGACDAAAAFAQAGFTASVVLDDSHLDGCNSELLAYSTETRNLEEAAAAAGASSACDRLLQARRLVLFKKVDSVLRGSPVAEIEAVRTKLGEITTVFNPALPAQGRMVVKGSLLVIDPETGRSLQPARKIPAGIDMHVTDAASFGDLRRIAAKSLSETNVPLFAGSAGLAEAVAAELASRLLKRPGAPAIQPSSQPALLLIGTPHAATEAQVAALKACWPGIEKSLSAAAREPAQTSTLVRLVWDSPPQLAGVAVRVRNNEFGGLVLSGGDTARYVLDAFEAGEIVLGGEIEPGVSWGSVRGGAADGVAVVTKSGGFGLPDLLIRILEAIAPPMTDAR